METADLLAMRLASGGRDREESISGRGISSTSYDSRELEDGSSSSPAASTRTVSISISSSSSSGHRDSSTGRSEKEERAEDSHHIQEVALRLKAHQEKITRRLDTFVEQLLQAASNENLIRQILSFFNKAMSSAFLKAKNGSFLKTLHSPKKIVHSPVNFDSLMQEVRALQEGDVKEYYDLKMSLFEKILSLEGIRPKELFAKLLQKKEGFEFLIEITQKELELLFRKKADETLVKLWKIFNGAVVVPVLKAADFLRRSPEEYVSDDVGFDEEFFAKIVNNIYESISVIRSALNHVKEERRIKIEGFLIPEGEINTLQQVPPFFLRCLKDAMRDKIANDPLRQHIDTISSIAKRLQKPIRRRSFSGSAPSPSLERQRRPSDPLLSAYGIVDTDFMLRDETDNKAGVQVGYALSSWNHSSLLISPPSRMSSELSDEDDWVMIYETPAVGEIRRCYDLNSVLALLRRGPFVRLGTGFAINYALGQFFTVYPAIRSQITPYFVIGDVVGGVVGIVIGRRVILDPNGEPKLFFRALNAGSEGLLVFVFTLGGIIKIYLMQNPTVNYISNEKFYTGFVMAPFLLSLGHTIWYSFSEIAKVRWSSKNRCSHYVREGLNFFFNFLLFGSILQVSELNFLKIPSYIGYLLIPSVLSLATTAIRTFTRYGESVRSILSYLSLGNFIYMLSKEYSSPEYNNGEGFGSIADYGRVIFYGVAGSYSLFFMYKESRKFLLIFRDGELVTRLVSARNIAGMSVVPLPQSVPSLTMGTLRQPLISSDYSCRVPDEVQTQQSSEVMSGEDVVSPSIRVEQMSQRLQDIHNALDNKSSEKMRDQDTAFLGWAPPSRVSWPGEVPPLPSENPRRRCCSCAIL